MRQCKDKGHISHPQEKPQSTSTGGRGGRGSRWVHYIGGGWGGGLPNLDHIYIQSHRNSIAPSPLPPPKKKKRHLLSVQTHVGSFHPCGCFRSNPGTTSFQMRMRIRNDVDLGYLVRWDPRRCSTPKGGEVISRVERSSVVS